MERAFLADTLPLLMKGGLLIYIIPYPRATRRCAAPYNSDHVDSVVQYLLDKMQAVKINIHGNLYLSEHSPAAS